MNYDAASKASEYPDGSLIWTWYPVQRVYVAREKTGVICFKLGDETEEALPHAAHTLRSRAMKWLHTVNPYGNNPKVRMLIAGREV